jgi:hypothetical protein
LGVIRDFPVPLSFADFHVYFFLFFLQELPENILWDKDGFARATHMINRKAKSLNWVFDAFN